MLVLVDLDDTLCDTWEAGKYSIVRLLPYLLRRRKFQAFLYIVTALFFDDTASPEIYTLDFDRLVERVMGKIYSKVHPEELEEITELIDRVFFSNIKLYPDAITFLRGVKRMGARLVLVTDSSSKWQRKKLEHLGIKDYFDALIISGETGHSKLEPHNFRLAKHLFPDDEVYVVGDRDDTDMQGGKMVGATTILVSRGYFSGRLSKHADYVVGSLSEALEVIKREHEKRA